MYNYNGLINVNIFSSFSAQVCHHLQLFLMNTFSYFLVLSVSKPFLIPNSMHAYLKFPDETWC